MSSRGGRHPRRLGDQLAFASHKEKEEVPGQIGTVPRINSFRTEVLSFVRHPAVRIRAPQCHRRSY